MVRVSGGDHMNRADLQLVFALIGVIAVLWTTFTFFRLRGERAINASTDVIQEAWDALTKFRLHVRHWADGITKSEVFFAQMQPVFTATLDAFHRAQLVLDPKAGALLESLFSKYAAMRSHAEIAQQYRTHSEGKGGAYASEIREHHEKWKAMADEIDATVDRVHVLFQRQLFGWRRGTWWAWRRRRLHAKARPWLATRKRRTAETP
jgi:hypothetical protein